MRRMTGTPAVVATIALLLGLTGQPVPVAAGPYDVEDNIMGEYAGTFKPLGAQPVQGQAKVIALGKDKAGDFKYRIILMRESLRPGAENIIVQFEDKRVGTDKVDFTGDWKGGIAGGKLTAKASVKNGGAFDLGRTVRRSPTLAKKPPEGAVVLLPFGVNAKVTLDAWKNKNWLLTDGGMQVNKGGQFTVGEFGDCMLHVEFRTPYEPERRGQGRGNSGVYLQGRYEVQVLDSFGLKPGMGDCGSIYGVSITGQNMCSPPMQWQTYDIQFHAPRFDEDGKMIQKAKMMVHHNGTKIHDLTEIPGPTTAAPLKGNAPKGPLYLQDHGNPVQYRNIWLVETK